MKLPQQIKPTAMELLERDFVKCRAGLLEIAAFLDRLERYRGSAEAANDFRSHAIFKALEIVSSPGRKRVRDILLLLSDPTLEPAEDTMPPQRAKGAWKGVAGDH